MDSNANFNNFFQSKTFKWILLLIGFFVLLLLVFQLGITVGFRKASFSYRWAENYNQNFAGPRGGFFGDMAGGKDFIEANGVFGLIIKIGSSSLAIKGSNDVEKIILIKNDTVIKSLRDTIRLSDLKIDEPIVVIGLPNNTGQIEAKLIRVMPPVPTSSMPSRFPPLTN